MVVDQYSITFDSYVKFIKEKSIIDGAIIFFVGGMIKDFVTKAMKEIIIPLTRGKIDVIKKFNIYDYGLEIFQLVLTSYLLFVLHRTVDKNF